MKAFKNNRNQSRLQNRSTPAYLLTVLAALSLFLVSEKPIRAQKTATATPEQEEASGKPVDTPGYDVALGARDPFLPPDTGAIQGNQDELAASIRLLKEAVKVTIVVFGDVKGNEFAVVNGSRVKAGDKVTATVTGKKIALPVMGFHQNPPGIVLEYEGQEFIVYASQ
jgi:hypothetical protein